MVEGSYDDVNRLCTEVAQSKPWAFVNINVRALLREGSRTLAFEVAEQLGWRTPDHCVVPMASGSLFTKIWKGFKELHQVGLIDEPRTRMSGAQATGCSPIATAFEEGTLNFRPQKPNTIARSIAIGNPADGYYALKTLEETGGVGRWPRTPRSSEGMKLLAETEGIFAETAGGTTIACLKHMAERGQIAPGEETVAFITGGGLKTTEALQGGLSDPLHVPGPQRRILRGLRGAAGARRGRGRRRMMASRPVRFTFSPELIQEPLIYLIGREFEVVTNIRMADVDERVRLGRARTGGRTRRDRPRDPPGPRRKGVRVDQATLGDIVEG